MGGWGGETKRGRGSERAREIGGAREGGRVERKERGTENGRWDICGLYASLDVVRRSSIFVYICIYTYIHTIRCSHFAEALARRGAGHELRGDRMLGMPGLEASNTLVPRAKYRGLYLSIGVWIEVYRCPEGIRIQGSRDRRFKGLGI